MQKNSPPAKASPDPQASEKARLREELAAARRRLTEAERREKSALATAHLTGSPIWKAASKIFLFASLPDEISSWEAVRRAWEEGKELCLPALDPDIKGAMEFYRCDGEESLARGRFGILEPPRGAAAEDPDLIIIPGLAFDRAGQRLGYGGGYYDRYLGGHPEYGGRCLGLAFAFQILKELPAGPFDRRVSRLCTERGLYAAQSDLVSISRH